MFIWAALRENAEQARGLCFFCQKTCWNPGSLQELKNNFFVAGNPTQANVRVGKCAAPPIRALPSVIVDNEKVLREADGSVELVVVRPHADGKVFAPGCASKAGLVSRRGARRTQAVLKDSVK